MKRTDKYVQISLDGSKEILKGKVVKDVAFNDEGFEDEQQLIITFTDNTYIGVQIYVGDRGDCSLTDFCLMNPETVNDGRLDTRVDANGVVHLEKWCQQLVDLGLWEVSVEDVKKLQEDYEQRKRDREYQYYLKLREKYENYGK